MVSYRSSTPPNEILCGDYQARFKSPAFQCKTCKTSYHRTYAKMPLYYMVRYASSNVSFICKQCTEKSQESHWTDKVHLFKDCYPNLTDIENILDKNETDVRVETESISQTSRERAEASRQNFEDTPNNQDQDIMQKQIQERIQAENEINICKFYIKKCCKHGLRGHNCNYPHPAPCKKYIENPECRCGPECTNHHPDICKYFMQATT